MLKVSGLYIYPIKSLGGIKVDKALVTDRGFRYDRRWMLIDNNNRFISQREHASMALLTPHITGEYLRVSASDGTSIDIALEIENQDLITVAVWDDICQAQLVGKSADDWFSKHLNIDVRLVFMPDQTLRFTDSEYTRGGQITSFSDAYPFMMIGQASLDDLNRRLDKPLPVNRFRPNIVFTGGVPYQEDTMDNFTINNISFNGVKLCARCNIITIDQSTAVAAKEPTKTLASYRVKNNKIYFGQNLVHNGTGIISVGDEMCQLTKHFEERFIV
ncbi:MOSC domain-containing protein [Mucilaginibacter panaciglaebae]|uniref:MOSC domain-containing protein n=1 Tax=Mucilaginibacter panaciglaebae TaxID=502331 RepID=A0ABP7WJU1_9SPHI